MFLEKFPYRVKFYTKKMKMDMPLLGIVSMQGSLRLLISMTRHPGRERITGGYGDWTGKAIR